MSASWLKVDVELAWSSEWRLGVRLDAGFEVGNVLTMFGPSGVGKTSVLRAIAGLVKPESGRIEFGGRVWFDATRGVDLPVRSRGIGYVSQEPALFPHMTVRQNVEYGAARARDRGAVDRAVELVGVSGLMARHPSELSGGQKQRVALARALASGPGLLLLDEPLSALDEAARIGLRDDLRGVLKEWGVPTVLVTHDRNEALCLSDSIAVLTADGVAQHGPIAEVFSRPRTPAVAAAVGIETVVPGEIFGSEGVLSRVRAGEGGGAELTAVNERALSGGVLVCIRAVDVVIQRGGEVSTAGSARTRVSGRVTAVRAGVPLFQVTIDCGFELQALVTESSCRELGIEPGAEVVAMVKAPHVHLLPRG